jgi:hypothetical protein
MGHVPAKRMTNREAQNEYFEPLALHFIKITPENAVLLGE